MLQLPDISSTNTGSGYVENIHGWADSCPFLPPWQWADISLKICTLQSYMDSEIMSIMSQYMPLDNDRPPEVHTDVQPLRGRSTVWGKWLDKHFDFHLSRKPGLYILILGLLLTLAGRDNTQRAMWKQWREEVASYRQRTIFSFPWAMVYILGLGFCSSRHTLGLC